MSTTELRYNSGYLTHLAALAKEAKQRYRSIPSFNVMIAAAVVTHIGLLAPIHVLSLGDDVAQTRQVKLAFGVKTGQDEQPKPDIVKPATPVEKPNAAPISRKRNEEPAASRPTVNSGRNVSQTKRIQPAKPKAKELPSTTQSAVSKPRTRHQAVLRRPSSTQQVASTSSYSSASMNTQSGPAQNIQDVITKYEQLLSGWINSHQLDRTFNLAEGIRGRSVVRLRINRRGTIIFQSLERSSGYPELDKAALDAVSRSSPVPVVPDAYPGGRQLEFLIPINITVQ